MDGYLILIILGLAVLTSRLLANSHLEQHSHHARNQKQNP